MAVSDRMDTMAYPAELRVRLLEDRVEDLRRERDGWRVQAEVAQAFLNRRRGIGRSRGRRPWWRQFFSETMHAVDG